MILVGFITIILTNLFFTHKNFKTESISEYQIIEKIDGDNKNFFKVKDETGEVLLIECGDALFYLYELNDIVKVETKKNSFSNKEIHLVNNHSVDIIRKKIVAFYFSS